MTTNSRDDRIKKVFGDPIFGLSSEKISQISLLLQAPRCCVGDGHCSANLTQNNAQIISGLRLMCDKHARLTVIMDSTTTYIQANLIIADLQHARAEHERIKTREERVMAELRDFVRAHLAGKNEVPAELVTDDDVTGAIAKISANDLDKMKVLIRGGIEPPPVKQPVTSGTHPRTVASMGGGSFGGGNMRGGQKLQAATSSCS